WKAYGDPLQSSSAYALLGEALRGAAGILEGEPAEVRRDKLRAAVASHLPAAEHERVAEFLGELVGVPFPDEISGTLRAARLDARLMSARIARAFEDFVGAECAVHPVVLVLEDLHWADGPTVRLIDATLRGLKDRPLMVLALARPEVHEQFPRLWAEHQIKVQEIHLRELSRKAGERLVREVLGDAAHPETIDRLLALS